MRRRKTFAICVSVLLCFIATAVPAADQFKEGDEIEISYLGEWRPGKVMKTNQRGDVLAQFEFAGASQQKPFKASDVRYAYESGALARAKVWSDASGKFRLKAALIEIDDDTITLRKPDKTETKVPIAKLSESDQQFLKKLQKESGGGLVKPPKPPALEDFGGAATLSTNQTIAPVTTRAALAPDPLPAYLKLKQGGVGFPTDDFFDRLGAVLTVGGKDAWLLAAVENETPGKALPTRLLWASLERQKIEGRQLLPPGELVLDYHGPSHRLLTFSKEKGEKSRDDVAVLSLWEVTPTDAKVKPVVRWKADSGEGGLHEAWGRIIDADVVLQRWKKQEYIGWDVTAKKARYRITQESFFAPLATLSAGRKYLLMPEDKGVRIFEAATGRQVSSLPVQGGVAGIAVSEDGRKAAVLGQTTLSVWDLTDAAAAPQKYQAETIGTPFSAELFWVGDQRIMADDGHRGEVLFSLKLKLSLWNYQFDMNAIPKSSGHRVHEIIDQHLVYGAALRDGAKAGLAVGAVTLPGPQVNETESTVDPESLLVIKPGTPIRLDVRAGENNARVQAALEAKIQANGWTLSPTATTVLVAEMKRGDQQTINYRFGGFGKPESTQSATVVPFISSAKIMIGEQVAWQSGTSSGAPGIVMLKEGQTVQNEVDRWQKPNVEFFDKVEIPPRIMDPAKKNGLGTTQVTNRGLIVDSKRGP